VVRFFWLADTTNHPGLREATTRLTWDIAGNIIKETVRAYVLDTDVLVAALRSDAGASRRILTLALNRRFEILLSVPLLFEYEAVLTRPEHLTASGASAQDVSDVLDGLAAVARRVTLAFRWRPMLRDPDDDMVFETAIHGGARAIITFNERDFLPVASEFGCLVMRPGAFLRLLESEIEWYCGGIKAVRRSNFALRLQPSLLDEARKLAESEGVALNQLINVAVAEKVSALRTEEYFAERARRADPRKIARILKRVGKGKAPVKGDELSDEFRDRSTKGRKSSRLW
jgi:putative PIN family toxin of toxin-antitoxin system